MLFKRINLISSFVNNFNKTKRTDFLNKKFIEEENCSFFDENGNRKIKSKQSEEKKIKFDHYILKDIKNYRKNEEENKKNYFNKFIKFRNVKEEINPMKKNKKRFPDIINLKKRLYLLEENKSFNNEGLRYNYASFLFEGKNPNNKFNNSNSLNKLNKFNYSTFNSSNQISRKSKFLESINSKIKLNIIRKRIHTNRYTNLIQSQKKLLNVKLNKIKKRESFNKNISQNETSNTNNNTNEINLTNNEEKDKTYNKNIPKQKYNLKNFLVDQDYLKISGKKLKWENKIKMRKTFSIVKIMSKYGQNKGESSLFRQKLKNDLQTDMTYISTDRRNDDVIKPIRLKNFYEWKNDTEKKNKLKNVVK